MTRRPGSRTSWPPWVADSSTSRVHAKTALDGSPSSAVLLGGLAGVRAQRALQITLHRVQLCSPVLPTVGAVGREVEHGVVTARSVVCVLELLVAADHEIALKERGRQVGTAQLVRRSVAAVHPEPGVVGDELADVDRGVVALPCRVTVRPPHVFLLVAAGVTHRQAYRALPGGRAEVAGQRTGVDELSR